MINIFSPFEEKYFNKKSIANKEDKNAVIRPTKRGGKPSKKNSLMSGMRLASKDNYAI